MMDTPAELEKLKVQLAECETTRDLATEAKKREFFTRLADPLQGLIGALEKAVSAERPPEALGRESFLLN